MLEWVDHNLLDWKARNPYKTWDQFYRSSEGRCSMRSPMRTRGVSSTAMSSPVTFLLMTGARRSSPISASPRSSNGSTPERPCRTGLPAFLASGVRRRDIHLDEGRLRLRRRRWILPDSADLKTYDDLYEALGKLAVPEAVNAVLTRPSPKMLRIARQTPGSCARDLRG